MLKFLFQPTVPEFDFQNQLRHSLVDGLMCRDSEYIIVDDTSSITTPKDWCPVGSVEFCEDWFTKKCGLNYTKPRNLPECLFHFRWKDIPSNDTNKFLEKALSLGVEWCCIKSNDIIKHPKNGAWPVKTLLNEKPVWLKNFQITAFNSNIKSEWRIFVFRNKIVGAKNYLGDPFIVPDKGVIENYISILDDKMNVPPAYTLDVFVDEDTRPLEMHDFFACGLYGFDKDVYPYMLTQWFSWYKLNDGLKKSVIV